MKDMDDTFATLARAIQEECTDRPVYYVANPGNWGDALIRAGTLRFFRATGLRYTELPWRHSSRGAKIRWWLGGDTNDGVLIVGGGGAWCDLWNHYEDVKAMQRPFRSTIVLPSTYQGSYSLPATKFICRDTRES